MVRGRTARGFRPPPLPKPHAIWRVRTAVETLLDNARIDRDATFLGAGKEAQKRIRHANAAFDIACLKNV
jgi:hypothetical protein